MIAPLLVCVQVASAQVPAQARDCSLAAEPSLAVLDAALTDATMTGRLRDRFVTGDWAQGAARSAMQPDMGDGGR